MILTGLPVAILLVWSHGKDFAKRANRQVVAYSSSLAIVILSIIIGLNTLGGSMTYEVEIEDAAGNKETISVLKDQFVPSLQIFSFENIGDSTEADWLGDGIAQGISLDLHQFNYIYPSLTTDSMSLAEKVAVARTGSHEYMVEGSFAIEGAGLKVNMILKRTSDLKEVNQEVFQFKNVLAAADSLSLVLRNWLEIDPVIMKRELDMPLSSFLTQNQEAYKYFVQGNWEAAVNLDSGFAVAAEKIGWYHTYYQRSRLGARSYLELAIKYIDHLPKTNRNEILVSYYLANQQPQKALRILTNELKIRPKDLELLDYKAFILGINLDPEYVSVMDKLESLWHLTIWEQFNMATMLFVHGQPDDAFQRVAV